MYRLMIPMFFAKVKWVSLKSSDGQLSAALMERRNEIGTHEFGISYEDMLKDKEGCAREIKWVRSLQPNTISEAEPK